MIRRVAFLAVMTGVVLSVAGCLSSSDFERRASWRDEAERVCLRNREVSASAWIEQAGKINGRGPCGVAKPLKVSALADGSISLGPVATIGCPMTAALERWVEESVQPAAIAWFGMPVTDIKQISAYYCRPKNNVRGASLSEHAFGNALDVAGFTLLDGRSITVVKGWKGSDDERGFLREVFAQSCNYFTTTLGPGVKYHGDHFHLDLARHNSDGTSRYCRPKLEIPPLRPRAGQMVVASHAPPPVMGVPGTAYPAMGYPPQNASPFPAVPPPPVAEQPSDYPDLDQSVGPLPETYWPRRLPPAEVPMSYAP